MDRKLQRHRADSLRQHGFLVNNIKLLNTGVRTKRNNILKEQYILNVTGNSGIDQFSCNSKMQNSVVCLKCKKKSLISPVLQNT